MRHQNRGRKFGRKKGQRKAFMKGLVTNLVQYERIETTEARAKDLRKTAERMITYGKKKSQAGLRLLMQHLPKKTAYKVFHEIAPRYADRKGGYTRITKSMAPRKNDASKMATIEFV